MGEMAVEDGVRRALAGVAQDSGPHAYAVAYVTRWETVKHLGAGDVLVCAGDESVLASGSVDPKVLRRLAREGVSVWARHGLHSKVFTSGTRAVVGSANATKNSLELDEAAVVVTAAAEVKAWRKWVRSIATPDSGAIEVDGAWLEWAANVWRPPLPFTGGHRPRQAVWIANFFEEEPSAAVEAAIEAEHEEVATSAEVELDLAEPSWDRPRKWRPGDRVLEVRREPGVRLPDSLVCAPAVCVSERPVDRDTSVYWWILPEKEPRLWSHLRSEVLWATGVSLRVGDKVSSRKVLDAVHAVFDS